MGKAAGQDDPVDLPVSSRRQRADRLGRAVQHGVVDQLGLFVARRDPLLHLPGIAGAQMSLQATAAPDIFHQILLGIFAGEAQMDQALAVLSAAAFRREQQLVVTYTVHHLAVDEQPHRCAAAQMQHDETARLQRLVHHLVGAADSHSAAVEGVAHHPAVQHGHAGNTADGCHLVHCHRIVHISGDPLLFRDLQRDNATQVGGVCTLLDAVHIVAHLLVHHKCTGGAGRQLAAAGTHRIQRIRRYVFLRQHLFHNAAPEIHLLHHTVKGGKLLSAVAQRLLKQAVLSFKKAGFRGSGAGVDHKDAITHGRFLLFK